ncbi:histidine kinase [Sphingobacterium sp. DK4209]|uniref:Histidine kinase n=2 Tax=Sphingobacterium zhuxiongii TaxID=2662364 RepID=A0A5Q0QE11_9SPHI|nr:sensor histidine kinase [Sphingobacterium sp. dk4302]MVZ65924.1 histidine kinase [Sphingobacterium sp. DK4209]QGA28065.1 histidine kinase [Sphingobacterium sp. dk4302]
MKYFLKSLLYTVIITSVLYFLFSVYYMVKSGSKAIEDGQQNALIATLTYSILLGLSGTYTASFLQRIIPGKNKMPQRFLVYMLITQIIAPLVVFFTTCFFQVFIYKKSFATFVSQIYWVNYIMPTVIAMLIGSGFYLFGIYMERKNAQLEKQKQIAGEATAQLETLKNQIDPHFLFNSLNVLIGLIEENKENAIIYTQSLSKIYRYILEQKDKTLVPIKNELDFAKNYIALLTLRFEDAIQVQMHCDDIQEEMQTVPLALQLLLENCIQHNKISQEHPLNISIRIENNILLVENNLQPKTHVESSTKIGLRNIRERYAIISQKNIEVIQTPEVFRVELPIL